MSLCAALDFSPVTEPKLHVLPFSVTGDDEADKRLTIAHAGFRPDDFQ